MMESTIMNGMCRCCATEGAFKDFKTAYTWMGEEEVYADMLRECFDISLSSSEHGEDGGICEVCITQLRNASNFKKQVLSTEEQFKKHALNKLFRPNIVKVEVTADDTNDTDDNLSAEEGYSGTEFEVPIKKETEEPKPKKRAAATKATTSRAKKAKTESGETSTKRPAQATRHIKIERPTKTKPAIDTAKNKVNLTHILLNSNANPIRCKDSFGYGCIFCPKKFPEPNKLKIHFLEEHDNDNLDKFMSARLLEHVIKLDITYLHCSLCDKDINKLDDFMTHLKTEHKKPMYLDVKNHILPFKFDTPELKCTICSTEFLTFKLLQEHMNSHYSNYICDLCGAGFVIDKLRMRHVQRHGSGEFKCDQCDKIFVNQLKRREHQKRIHLGSNARHNCKFCSERFIDYWKKMNHMIKEHGEPPVVLNCSACDRTFNNRKLLSRHMRKDHLMERKHKCSECDMKFFVKKRLQEHMAKHTGLRQFKCDICLKAYGRKNTLKQHMRIHANDRRFACTHCGQAFVQKCSWRSHMRSKHGEEV